MLKPFRVKHSSLPNTIVIVIFHLYRARYGINMSKYLPIIIYTTIATIAGTLLDGKSIAQTVNCLKSLDNCHLVGQSSQPKLLLAQDTEPKNSTSNPKRDLENKISISADREDKSLLEVRASITNRGEQPHYVYYIVAKFVAGETPIKQTIIPVNTTIKPGETTNVTHEILKESFSPMAIKNIKPVVIKSEYR